MPDLVGNPEDWFSQNEAHFEALLDGKNLWVISASDYRQFQENHIDFKQSSVSVPKYKRRDNLN